MYKGTKQSVGYVLSIQHVLVPGWVKVMYVYAVERMYTAVGVGEEGERRAKKHREIKQVKAEKGK